MTRQHKECILDAGYETLFVLGSFLGVLIQPTFRNVDWFFDEVVYGSRAKRQQLKRLEERGLVQSTLQAGRWVPMLTELGRTVFDGGRNPETSWNRPWDGLWRILTFDLPRKERSRRWKMEKWLHVNHFGRIQGSVWLHPDPVSKIQSVVSKESIHPKMMTVFEGHLAGGMPDREVVAAAWDFEEINGAYQDYIGFAEGLSLRLQASEDLDVRKITREDRQCWWTAVRADPLLPRVLHPKGYLGTKAWKTRAKLLRKLRAAMISAARHRRGTS